jgi:hypothetical protein
MYTYPYHPKSTIYKAEGDPFAKSVYLLQSLLARGPWPGMYANIGNREGGLRELCSREGRRWTTSPCVGASYRGNACLCFYHGVMRTLAV